MKMHQRFGRYELLKEIGSGGMAVVYLARVLGEGGFERLVALKKLHEQMARDPAFVDMFLDEARLAAQIRHPNVVPTIDVCRQDELLFLVMEKFFYIGMALPKNQETHSWGLKIMILQKGTKKILRAT